MPIQLVQKIFIAAVSFAFVGLLNSPVMAISLDEAIQASLRHSKAVAAARQNWIATREAVGTNTSTSDLSARLTSNGILANTDDQKAKAKENSVVPQLTKEPAKEADTM